MKKIHEKKFILYLSFYLLKLMMKYTARTANSDTIAREDLL